jgi:PAS domain S-box-containing protein
VPGRADDAGSSLAEASTDITSPLAVIPGVAELARVAADAIMVTDVHRRLVLWNDASVNLYGITAEHALGRVIDDLYDSTVVGHGTSSAGARAVAIAQGSWRGRVADRPRMGRYEGREIIIDAVLSRVNDADGNAVGVMSIKRDVTAAARIEAELATLGSLATMTDVARTRQAIAEGVLDVLVRATGAVAGAILSTETGRTAIHASRGIGPRVRDLIERFPSPASLLGPALRTQGSVVSGPTNALPMRPESRDQLLLEGIRAVVGVGLHRHGEPVGLLLLAFGEASAVLPSNATMIQASVHVQRAIDNARLVEELEAQSIVERRLIDQQLALQSLTELSESSDEFAVLAERTLEVVVTVLGAAAGSYTVLGGTNEAVDWFSTRVPDEIAESLRTLARDPATPLGRFGSGEGPYIETYSETTVARPASLELARAAGWTGCAALPIVIRGTLEGILVAYFRTPVERLSIDPRTLAAIARVASISLANFRLRARLLASEQRYRTLFDSSPEPYLVESLDGRIIHANAAAGRVYGASPAELRGLPLEKRTKLDEAEGERRRALTRELGHATFRGIGIRSDGSTFPEEAIISIVELDGRSRVLALVRDLSEQQHLQQELVQAQKMEAIGQLVSGVAHELNNPLAAILGFSQLMRLDKRLPPDLRHNADLLVEEATRTRRIVQNLLDFARQRPPERYPTSIRALVESILVLQSYSLGPGRILVDVDIPANLPPVEPARSQIQQVFVNLTQNAIHAIRAGHGRRLRIAARLEGDEDAPSIRVSVTDDGIGVSPEDIPKLFVPFFTTKPPTEGTGLGLPVSFGIVAAHGGELRYEPTPGQRGSTFSFHLPVRAVFPVGSGDPERERTSAAIPVLERAAQRPDAVAASLSRTSAADPGGAVHRPEAKPAGALPAGAVGAAPPAAAGPAPAPSDPSTRDRRILVLDDEPSIRTLLGKSLRGAGYEPVVASSGEEALAIVREGPFAAMLCDHRMAGMTGIEVYDAIVSIRPELGDHFVLMSGDVLNPTLRSFARDHRVTLLAKPFDLEAVDRTLRAVIANGRPSA